MTVPPAGLVTRAAGWLVDAFVVGAVAGAGVLTVELVAALGGRRPAGIGRWTLLALPALLVVYQATFWALAGRTPGMALFGVRVRGRRGPRPPWPAALVRAVVLLAFPVGALWCAVDRRHRGVHDLAARTTVVRVLTRRE